MKRKHVRAHDFLYLWDTVLIPNIICGIKNIGGIIVRKRVIIKYFIPFMARSVNHKMYSVSPSTRLGARRCFPQ